MKSTVLGLTLLLSAAVAWTATPPPSQTNPAPRAASQAKCRAAANMASPSNSTPVVDLGFTPKPIFATGCTAEVECPLSGGNTTPLSCTGASSCSVGEYSVTCDGHTTYCGCVGCDFCTCDCLAGGGTATQCLRECRFNC